MRRARVAGHQALAAGLLDSRVAIGHVIGIAAGLGGAAAMARQLRKKLKQVSELERRDDYEGDDRGSSKSTKEGRY